MGEVMMVPLAMTREVLLEVPEGEEGEENGVEKGIMSSWAACWVCEWVCMRKEKGN
jgi:hypothetical protein